MELGRERVAGDAQVVEERTSDEALDAHRLRLATEATDEAAIEVGPAADAVTVAIVGIGVSQDALLLDLGQRADAEERDRVAVGQAVGRGVFSAAHRDPVLGTASRRDTHLLEHRSVGCHACARGHWRRLELELRQHAVDAEIGSAAIWKALPDQQEVSIARRATSQHRPLVTARARRDVEVRAESVGGGELDLRDLLAARKRFELRVGRVRNRLTELTEDVVGDRRITTGTTGESEGEDRDR